MNETKSSITFLIGNEKEKEKERKKDTRGVASLRHRWEREV
jgi:hypothetical protein